MTSKINPKSPQLFVETGGKLFILDWHFQNNETKTRKGATNTGTIDLNFQVTWMGKIHLRTYSVIISDILPCFIPALSMHLHFISLFTLDWILLGNHWSMYLTEFWCTIFLPSVFKGQKKHKQHFLAQQFYCLKCPFSNSHLTDFTLINLFPFSRAKPNDSQISWAN